MMRKLKLEKNQISCPESQLINGGVNIQSQVWLQLSKGPRWYAAYGFSWVGVKSSNKDKISGQHWLRLGQEAKVICRVTQKTESVSKRNCLHWHLLLYRAETQQSLIHRFFIYTFKISSQRSPHKCCLSHTQIDVTKEGNSNWHEHSWENWVGIIASCPSGAPASPVTTAI